MSDVIADVLADPAVGVAGAAVGTAILALWVAAAWWAYADAARRTDSTLAAVVAAGWVVVSTPLLMPFALAIYALARPQQTASEQRTRHLAEALVEIAEQEAPDRCPACRTDVDASWLRCPTCATWLAAPCVTCGRWSDASLTGCPWCGSEERAAPAVERLEDREPRTLRQRRARRRLRPVGPGLSTTARAGAAQPAQRRGAPTPDGRPLAPLRGR